MPGLKGEKAQRIAAEQERVLKALERGGSETLAEEFQISPAVAYEVIRNLGKVFHDAVQQVGQDGVIVVSKRYKLKPSTVEKAIAEWERSEQIRPDVIAAQEKPIQEVAEKQEPHPEIPEAEKFDDLDPVALLELATDLFRERIRQKDEQIEALQQEVAKRIDPEDFAAALLAARHGGAVPFDALKHALGRNREGRRIR